MSQVVTQEKESFQLWRSNNLGVLEQLVREGTTVTLGLPTGFDLASDPVQLAGLLSNLKGNVAHFLIQRRDPTPVKPTKLADGNIPCEVSFTNMQATVAGYMEPIGYTGSGDILGVENGPDGQPAKLTLRVSHRFTTRRVRRFFRLDWKYHMQAMVGLHVVSPIPENRHELRNILELALRDEAARPKIVNISAGGVCLCVDKELATRPLAGQEYYLFIFSQNQDETPRPPEILLSKKVGMRRDICDEGRVGLRLQFQRELNWRNSQIALAWRDIADVGSAVINRLVENACADIFKSQEPGK